MACLHLPGAEGRPRAEDDLVGEEAPVQEPIHTIALDQQMNGMFGSGEGDGGREKAASLLTLEIDRLDAVCGLNEAQRAKCATAANLEATQMTTALVSLRRKYEGRVVEFQSPEGQALWQQFHQDLQAVQRTRPGGARSLLGRVMAGILDAEQRTAWKGELEQRSVREWRRSVDRGLEQIEPSIGLTSRQHDEIVALLLEDPPRLDTVKIRDTFGEGNPQLGWYALSQAPEDRLKALLTEHQWGKLKPVLQQGEAWTTMIRTQMLLEE